MSRNFLPLEAHFFWRVWKKGEFERVERSAASQLSTHSARSAESRTIFKCKAPAAVKEAAQPFIWTFIVEISSVMRLSTQANCVCPVAIESPYTRENIELKLST